MKVYLTGVNAIKSPKTHSKDSISSLHNKQNIQDINKENEYIKEEDISLESEKKGIIPKV